MAIDGLSTALLYYYVGSSPMVDFLNNFTQIFNELIILVSCWSLFLFTNYVPDPRLRHKFGKGFIYLLGFNVIVNLILMVYVLCKKAKLALKSKLCKK